jgi:hypothetical protein
VVGDVCDVEGGHGREAQRGHAGKGIGVYVWVEDAIVIERAKKKKKKKKRSCGKPANGDDGRAALRCRQKCSDRQTETSPTPGRLAAGGRMAGSSSDGKQLGNKRLPCKVQVASPI